MTCRDTKMLDDISTTCWQVENESFQTYLSSTKKQTFRVTEAQSRRDRIKVMFLVVTTDLRMVAYPSRFADAASSMLLTVESCRASNILMSWFSYLGVPHIVEHRGLGSGTSPCGVSLDNSLSSVSESLVTDIV